MTALGAVFLVVLAVIAAREPKQILLVACLAMPFEDSAVVNVGPLTVGPYYTALIALVLMTARGELTPKLHTEAAARAGWVWKTLLIYVTLLSLLAPFVFRGLGVVASGLGLDEQYRKLSVLQFSVSNVAQVVYLSLNIYMLLHVLNGGRFRRSWLATGLLLGLLTATSAIVIESLSLDWPHFLFDNSIRGFYAPVAESYLRTRGQFSEPSHLGAFAVTALAFGIGLWSEHSSQRYKRMAGGILLTALACIWFSGSATGLTATLCLGILAAAGFFYRLIVHRRLSLPGLFSLLTITAIAPLCWRQVYAYLETEYSGKQITQSYLTRSFVDANAVDLLFKSWGFGVGLGSNQASSLALALISSMGVVGFVTFLLGVVLMMQRARLSGKYAEPWAILGFLCAGFVSFADITAPFFWLCLAGCAIARTQESVKTLGLVDRNSEMQRSRILINIRLAQDTNVGENNVRLALDRENSRK